MNIYHIWCDLKPGTGDLDFCQDVSAYLDHLKAAGRIEGYRITRRKLGLGPSHLPEFHLMLEVEGLAQLDEAFKVVSSRSDPTESLHFGVNSLVQDVSFALYRDFPDPGRQFGEEKF